MPDPNLEKLYHHIFSTLGQTRANSNQLTHDLVLWMNHHIFEELPDALEYYLANPNSDLEADVTHLDLLDQGGVQVTICPTVTIYILTEFCQPIQVQSHLEMPGILVQLGRIQRT